MGPIRSLSGMNDDVLEQTNEVQSLVRRLRDANRRLTGTTGEAPTPLNAASGGSGEATKLPAPPPLLIRLTQSIEALNAATSDLRAEVSYLENFSETGSDEKTGGLSGMGQQGFGTLKAY
jgi:hypothetical protein